MDEENSDSCHKKSSKLEKKPKPIESKIIVSPEDYVPLSKECKVIGTFNPGATQIKTENGLETLLIVRVAESPSKEHPFWLPFFKIPNKYPPSKLEIDFDKLSKQKILENDKKSVKLENNVSRLKHISLPRLIKLNEKGEVTKRCQDPCLYPSWEFERFGIEDIRITAMERGDYIITYVCPHREFGVSTAFLRTKAFEKFESVIKNNTPRPIFTGIKDVVVFSKKVPSPSETATFKKGSKLYAALVRPNAFSGISCPGIWLSYSPDLVHWGQEHRLIISEKGEITGTGSSLIEINNKWVGPYHEIIEEEKIEYHTKLISLNKKDPWKDCKTSGVLLKRSDYLDILPYEGYIPNVVFTTGIIHNEGITTFFSGIDDTWTVMDKFYTEDLVKFLKK